MRLRKGDGLAKYIELYEEGKDDFEREIRSTWNVYSRVLDKSLPCFREIFNSYLQMEG